MERNAAKIKYFLVLYPVANQKPEVKRSDKHAQITEINVNCVILGIESCFVSTKRQKIVLSGTGASKLDNGFWG